MNCRPERLDPPRRLLAMVDEMGCKISIDTDAHAPGQLAWQPYGCARVAETGIGRDRIVNTWPVDDLLAWTASHDAPPPDLHAGPHRLRHVGPGVEQDDDAFAGRERERAVDALARRGRGGCAMRIVPVTPSSVAGVVAEVERDDASRRRAGRRSTPSGASTDAYAPLAQVGERVAHADEVADQSERNESGSRRWSSTLQRRGRRTAATARRPGR